tara:strand:+ start:1720 stop:2676 length:957 start_codon:yes stop_codon:yes gene_type:complete
MPNWKKLIVSGSDASLNSLNVSSNITGSKLLISDLEVTSIPKLPGLSAQSSEATSLMIDGSGVVGTRELGSNAFNSTTITPDGGNADQVDGLHASSFIRSDATDTATGALTFTGDSKFTGQTNFQIMGDSNAIFVSSSATYDPSNDIGKLFIGGYQSGNTAISGIIIDYTQPSVNLTSELVTTNGVDIQIQNQSTSKTTGALKVAGGVGIAKTLNVGEDIVAYASSDKRLKDNIKPIEGALDKISQISGNTFNWNDNHEVFKGKRDIGVIAQEVEKIAPEIVETRENGYKAVKYEKLVPILIEAIKELSNEIEILKNK